MDTHWVLLKLCKDLKKEKVFLKERIMTTLYVSSPLVGIECEIVLLPISRALKLFYIVLFGFFYNL